MACGAPMGRDVKVRKAGAARATAAVLGSAVGLGSAVALGSVVALGSAFLPPPPSLAANAAPMTASVAMPTAVAPSTPRTARTGPSSRQAGFRRELVTGLMANGMKGVSCPAVGSCTAVGYYNDNLDGGTGQALVEQLAGGSWAIVKSPDATSATNVLNAVSCSTATSCVAVGYYDDGGRDRALVETLTDGSWSLAAAADDTSSANVLNGVSCWSPTACEAVGYYEVGGRARTLVEALSGGTWHLEPSPDETVYANVLDAVSCPAAGACRAVGYFSNGRRSRNLVETLALGTWKLEASPDDTVYANELQGVSCPSVTSCTAVGFYQSGGVHDQALVLSLASGKWVLVPSPDETSGANVLDAVSCPVAGSCVAVGDYQGATATTSTGAPGQPGTSQAVEGAASAHVLLEQQVSGSWALGQAPDATSGANVLRAVSCAAQAWCSGAGYFFDGDEDETLLETGSGGAWTVAPSLPITTPTKTVISASPDPASVGEEVTYRATVQPAPAGGAVDFTDDGSSVPGCGAVPPGAGGVATCSLTYWSGGQHAVEAFYSGNDGFDPSTSALEAEQVAYPSAGYWLATKQGAVFGLEGAQSLGGITTSASTGPVVGIASTPTGHGYWVVTADGTVAAFGDAKLHGDLVTARAKASDIVAIAPTFDGGGYWLVGRDGGLFAFGDATYHGSLPALKRRVDDIVGMVSAPGGAGYLLVGSDGGVFAFGQARYHGSLPAMKVHVRDVKAILPATSGSGYVLVGADGGAFVFGKGVTFEGSLPSRHVDVDDIVGIALTPDDGGYFMAGSDGQVYAFGDARPAPMPHGLAGDLPVVAIAGT